MYLSEKLEFRTRSTENRSDPLHRFPGRMVELLVSLAYTIITETYLDSNPITLQLTPIVGDFITFRHTRKG